MKVYRVIRSYYEVLIPLEKQSKIYKVKVKTEPRRFLTVLRSKTYLVYISTRNIVIKTLFIKLYEPKNLLVLEGVSKLIEIRPLNDVVITKDSIRKRISLDLLEIDDIGSSELTTLKALRSSRPSELLVPRPFKLPKPKNRPLKPIFKLPEKLIKLMDFSDPDEM